MAQGATIVRAIAATRAGARGGHETLDILPDREAALFDATLFTRVLNDQFSCASASADFARLSTLLSVGVTRNEQKYTGDGGKISVSHTC